MKSNAMRGQLVLALISVGVGAFAGCSGGGSSGGGSSIAASTTATNTSRTTTTSTTTTTTSSTIATTGTKPTKGPLPGLATSGPTITITSPARGSFTSTMVAHVQGTVTDPLGIAGVFLQGNAIVLGTGGTIDETIALTPGLNTIVVQAFNAGFGKSESSLALVAGNFSPETVAVSNALELRLNTAVFDVISKLALSMLNPATLQQQILARNPLYSGPLGITVNATSITMGQPVLVINPIAGALAVHVEVPKLNLGVHIDTALFGMDGNVTADDVKLDTQVVVTVQGGVITATTQNTNVTLTNFGFSINPIPGFLTGLIAPLLQGIVTDQIKKAVDTMVPQLLDKTFAGFTKPVTQTIMGATATFTITPTAVTFDPMGLAVMADGNAGVLPVPGYQPIPAPGSLVTKGGIPTLASPKPDFLVSANTDFLNRVAYVAWHAGITDMTIDTASATKLGLPTFLALNTGLIQTFLPEFQGKLPTNDPISIVISSKLPPIFAAKSGVDPVEAGLGELELSIYDTATAQPTLILTLALHMKLQANATLATGNILQVSVGPNMFFESSLVSSPIVPTLNPNGLTNFVQFTVPPIIQILAGTWSGYPLPLYPGISPQNVLVTGDGPQMTFVTIKGDL